MLRPVQDRCALEPANSSLSDLHGIGRGPQAQNTGNHKMLDRLKKENVDLRNKTIDLALQIQILRDAVRGRA